MAVIGGDLRTDLHKCAVQSLYPEKALQLNDMVYPALHFILCANNVDQRPQSFWSFDIAGNAGLATFKTGNGDPTIYLPMDVNGRLSEEHLDAFLNAQHNVLLAPLIRHKEQLLNGTYKTPAPLGSPISKPTWVQFRNKLNAMRINHVEPDAPRYSEVYNLGDVTDKRVQLGPLQDFVTFGAIHSIFLNHGNPTNSDVYLTALAREYVSLFPIYTHTYAYSEEFTDYDPPPIFLTTKTREEYWTDGGETLTKQKKLSFLRALWSWVVSDTSDDAGRELDWYVEGLAATIELSRRGDLAQMQNKFEPRTTVHVWFDRATGTTSDDDESFRLTAVVHCHFVDEQRKISAAEIRNMGESKRLQEELKANAEQQEHHRLQINTLNQQLRDRLKIKRRTLGLNPTPKEITDTLETFARSNYNITTQLGNEKLHLKKLQKRTAAIYKLLNKPSEQPDNTAERKVRSLRMYVNQQKDAGSERPESSLWSGALSNWQSLGHVTGHSVPLVVVQTPQRFGPTNLIIPYVEGQDWEEVVPLYNAIVYNDTLEQPVAASACQTQYVNEHRWDDVSAIRNQVVVQATTRDEWHTHTQSSVQFHLPTLSNGWTLWDLQTNALWISKRDWLDSSPAYTLDGYRQIAELPLSFIVKESFQNSLDVSFRNAVDSTKIDTTYYFPKVFEADPEHYSLTFKDNYGEPVATAFAHDTAVTITDTGVTYVSGQSTGTYDWATKRLFINNVNVRNTKRKRLQVDINTLNTYRSITAKMSTYLDTDDERNAILRNFMQPDLGHHSAYYIFGKIAESFNNASRFNRFVQLQNADHSSVLVGALNNTDLFVMIDKDNTIRDVRVYTVFNNANPQQIDQGAILQMTRNAFKDMSWEFVGFQSDRDFSVYAYEKSMGARNATKTILRTAARLNAAGNHDYRYNMPGRRNGLASTQCPGEFEVTEELNPVLRRRGIDAKSNATRQENRRAANIDNVISEIRRCWFCNNQPGGPGAQNPQHNPRASVHNILNL